MNMDCFPKIAYGTLRSIQAADHDIGPDAVVSYTGEEGCGKVSPVVEKFIS